MRLFIAEKPNMGKTIASFLPGPHTKHRDYIETGGGLVTWCVGHLLEQAEPGAYGEKWAKFPGNLEDLPIVPDQWKLVAVDSKKSQVATIRKLLKQCTEVVHAGDPGREGQLIVDEILDFCGNRKPVQRILLNALDKATVMKALASLQPNSQFQSLYQAALGRQRADWMVGMNLSRAYTILGQKQNYRGVLPIGRVQTPTLAIVVRRDEEIENFVAKDFFSVHAQFKTTDADFWTTWIPPGNTLEADEDEEKDEDGEEEDEQQAGQTPPAAWQDEQRRVIDRTVADKVVADVKAAGFGTVSKAERKPVEEQAPILFELSTLQTELNGTTGAGVKDILAACQSLYEKGHVSYPRTDCAYMPESQHADAPVVLAAIANSVPALGGFMNQADASRKSRVFSDKKMVNQEHHAIVPTGSAPNMANLSSLEQALYEAVARRYLAQFLPVCEVDKSLIEVESAGHRFAVRGRIVRVPGWRVLFVKQTQAGAAKKEKPELPSVNDGQRVDVGDARVDSHRTTPPARYTQGTLLRAMKHVHLLVTDPVEKKKLKAVEGIGRAATRAAIVEGLLKRGLLQTQKNKLSSSTVARILVKNAPRPLVDPGLTARWETALDAVASGQVALSLFEQKQLQWIQGLLGSVGSITLPPPPPEAAWAPGQGSSGKRSGSRAGKSGKSGARKPPPANAPACPKCGKGVMVERQVRAGPHQGKKFKGCTNYPECKHSEWPK